MRKNINVLILLTAFLLISGCRAEAGKGGADYGAMKNQSSITAAYRSPAPMPQAAVMMDAVAMEMPAAEYQMREEAEAEDDSNSADLSNVERKLIKRAYIRIRVENLDNADASVKDLMGKYNAYAASTEIDENSRYYSLRVPAPEYDTFLIEMNNIGRLLQSSESTEDVTLRYYDLEGRLATKKELLRTFQAYLERARTIEEILSVEARISDLQYDIEGTGIQLRNLANRVDYSTIDLSLLGPVVSISNQNITFGEQIKKLFSNFGDFLSAVAVIILGFIIYGIPILLLVIFFLWVLFGRIGLAKKLWRLVMGKKQTDNP